MKKKLFAAVVAAAMSVCLLAVPAMADEVTGDGSIDGSSTVTEPTLRVVVPTNLDFAVNPYGIGAATIAGNQIVGANYAFANASDVPLYLKLDFTATVGDDVAAVVDTVALDSPDAQLSLAVVGFKTATINATSKTVTAATYDTKALATTAKTLVPFPAVPIGDGAAAETEASTGFLLAAGKDGAALTTAPGHCGFTFYGETNFGGWAADDLTISAAYTLTPVMLSTYTKLTTDATLKANITGVNQIKSFDVTAFMAFLQ